MKSINEYLNDLKEKNGSDYRTAKLLKIGIPSLSTIRSRGKMSDETAIKVADLLGVNREEVLIAAAIARSNGEVKEAWEKLSRLKGVTASFLVTIPILSTLYAKVHEGIVYIMLNRMERRKSKPEYLDYIEFLTLPRQDHDFIPRRR